MTKFKVLNDRVHEHLEGDKPDDGVYNATKVEGLHATYYIIEWSTGEGFYRCGFTELFGVDFFEALLSMGYIERIKE